MTRLRNEKSYFDNNYVPVIISSIVLLLLIAGLIGVIIYNPTPETKPEVPTQNEDGEYGLKGEELSIDNGKSKCSKDNQKKLVEDSSKVDVSLKITEEVDYSHKLKVSSEFEEEGKELYMTYQAYEISLKNISDNIYVTVTDNCSTISSSCKDETRTFNKDNVEKKVGKFTTVNVAKKIIYTVSIYSNISECENELIRKFTFTTPIYNSYYGSLGCENSDQESCGLLIYDEVNPQEIYDLGQKNEEAQKEKEEKEQKESQNTRLYIAIAVAAVVITVILCFIFRKKGGK